jgi:hypothetical protein
MVFGDVMIYLTELADKLGIDPVEAAKAKWQSAGRGTRQIWSRVERRSTRSFGNNFHPSTCRVDDTGVGLLLANFREHQTSKQLSESRLLGDVPTGFSAGAPCPGPAPLTPPGPAEALSGDLLASFG